MSFTNIANDAERVGDLEKANHNQQVKARQATIKIGSRTNGCSSPSTARAAQIRTRRWPRRRPIAAPDANHVLRADAQRVPGVGNRGNNRKYMEIV